MNLRLQLFFVDFLGSWSLILLLAFWAPFCVHTKEAFCPMRTLPTSVPSSSFLSYCDAFLAKRPERTELHMNSLEEFFKMLISAQLSLLQRRMATVSTCGRQTHKTGRNSPRLRLRPAAPPSRHRPERRERDVTHHLQGALSPSPSFSRDRHTRLCTLVQEHRPTVLSLQNLWHLL